MGVEPSRERGITATAAVASLDGVTDELLRVFGDVLGQDDVAEEDDFFDDAGGTSLQAWWAVVKIAEALGVDIEYADFLATRTARGTAAVLFEAVCARGGAMTVATPRLCAAAHPGDRLEPGRATGNGRPQKPTVFDKKGMNQHGDCRT